MHSKDALFYLKKNFIFEYVKISYGTPSPQNSDHIHIVKIFYHVPICVYYLQAMCEYYSANTFTYIMKQIQK